MQASKYQVRKEGHELVIFRTFNCRPERIFEAWTNPDELVKWWGPEGFTVPVCKVDLRVGGEYHYCTRSPEGANFWTKGVYQEIIPWKKIVATDSFSDPHGNVISASSVGLPGTWPSTLLVSVTFEESNGATLFVLKHEGLPKEMVTSCHTGWSESLDKLDALLSGTS